MGEPMTEQPTGVQLAIFNARMESVTRRMANTLLRTGRSGVINTARDFSCSLVTARGELLSVSEGFPIHMLRGADLMAQCMTSVHPTLKRGERVPPQFALSRQLTRRGPHHHRAGG
jgi:N-methylhydantoinase B/oxoprolinase/acetone carboxylase alpha subunit